MKATELRLGNYVYHESSTCKLETVLAFEDVEEYNPIPLTEEWLLKFGFWRNNNLCKRWFLAEAYLLERGWTQHRFYIYLEKKRISARHGCMGDSNHLKYLKYVHEFQNLFFALTGEELEIRNT